LASITPIVCTVDELAAARSARSTLIQGARKVRIVIDGDVTEWTQITLSQLNDTIAGMQSYQNSISSTAITAFSITGSKGF
jgi:gpW